MRRFSAFDAVRNVRCALRLRSVSKRRVRLGARAHPRRTCPTPRVPRAGDPTDNAVEFVRWLRDATRGPTTLAALKFTVFGLGNRQYEHYNRMGKVRWLHP